MECALGPFSPPTLDAHFQRWMRTFSQVYLAFNGCFSGMVYLCLLSNVCVKALHRGEKLHVAPGTENCRR